VEFSLPSETQGGGSGAIKGLKEKKVGKGTAGKFKMEDEEMEGLLDADEDGQMIFLEGDVWTLDDESGHRCQPSCI